MSVTTEFIGNLCWGRLGERTGCRVQWAEEQGGRSRRKESTEDSYSAVTRRGHAGLERAGWGRYF